MIDSKMVCLKRRAASRMPDLSPLAGCLAKPLAILFLWAAIGGAQQAGNDTPAPSTTLMSQFFDHDFVNYFAFGNAIYDTALPELKASANSSSYGGAFGYDVGGGITVGRNFKDGTLSFSYKGDYRHYNKATYSNGTDQDVSLLYTKQLNRRWNVALQGGGGILSYGGQFFSASAGVGSSVLTNPLSSQSRFANAGITLTYQQTRRLSYTFGGQFFMSNYNYAGAINSLGGSGNAAIDYRTTARTTVGGSYSHSYFVYGGSLGTSTIDGGYLTLSHTFTDHWFGSLSAGVSHSHSQGTITEPIQLLLGQQLVTGFVTGPYNRSNNSPSFNLSLTRNVRHSSFSLGGGQGINAGNGTFLTSKSQYANATYSLTRHLTNLSFGAGYTRLSSISNTVNSKYSSADISASYGFNLVRYVSANFRYDFIHYDALYMLRGVNESRLSVGLNFSSKSVPMTLF